MPTYLYHDAYLKPHVTQEREDRAVAEVASYGTFPTDWTERLVRLRAYCITCAECQATPDDLYASKLAGYRKEFNEALPHAKAAQDATTSPSGLGAVFSIPLERG